MKSKWLMLYIFNWILIVGYWMFWKLYGIESRGFEIILASLLIINSIYGCIKDFKSNK